MKNRRLLFGNDSRNTEVYTLSLHDALPILQDSLRQVFFGLEAQEDHTGHAASCAARPDRKSTRLNSSHTVISYAVFCMKNKTFPDDRSRNHHKPSTMWFDALGHRLPGPLSP